MSNVAYLCDRQACGERCSYPECRHTTDITHAVNFTCFDMASDKWIEKEGGKNVEKKD